MEDLLRSLRGLGLKPPTPDQLLDLLDSDPEVQKRLAAELALQSEGDDTGFITKDIVDAGVIAILETFRRSLSKDQDLVRYEVSAFADISSRPSEAAASPAPPPLEEESPAPKKGGKRGNQKASRQNDGMLRLVPRKALLMRALAEYNRRLDAAFSWAGYHPRLVLWGGPTFVCRSPLSQLSPMAISDLHAAPFRHVGQVLVGRVAAPVAFYVGATFVVDDSAGNAVPVAVAHFSDQLNASPSLLARLLPPGTLVAIKEPYVSPHHTARVAPASGKALPGIRIDTPTDLVVLTPDHPLAQGLIFKLPVEAVPAVDGHEDATPPALWMQLGPLARHAANPASSAKPKVSDRSILATVQFLYDQGRYQAAFSEVMAARGDDSVTPGLLARLAAGLQYAAQAYSAAAQELVSALGDAGEGARIMAEARKNDAEAEAREEALADALPLAADGQALDLGMFVTSKLADLLSHCAVMSSRGEKGAGPRALAACYAASQASVATPLALGSQFTGPVEVADIPNAGRGLVASRDIAPGELLLVAQAVGGAYALEAKATKGVPVLRLDCTQGAVGTTTQLVAATRVVTQLADRYDALALPVLGLTAGPNTENDSRVAQPYPLHWDTTLRAPSDKPSDLAVDAAYVDGVLRFNAFGPADPRAPAGELGRGTMPHPLPALLNHACFPSASSVFVGNTVATRATRQLRKGEEITHPYVRGEQAYALRQAQLSKHGFVCACTLCRADRADGDGLTRRQRMIAAAWAPVAAHARQVAKGRQGQPLTRDEVEDAVAAVEDFGKGLAETYAPERDPQMRPEMVQIHVLAAQLWAAAKASSEARDAYLAALGCVGVVLSPDGQVLGTPTLHADQATECILALAEMARSEGRDHEAAHWIQAAVRTHAVLAGASWAVFRDRWATERFCPLLDWWAASERSSRPMVTSTPRPSPSV